MKPLIFVGMNVFGALGWWIGEQFGLGTAIIASGIGSILGVDVGLRVARLNPNFARLREIYEAAGALRFRSVMRLIRASSGGLDEAISGSSLKAL